MEGFANNRTAVLDGTITNVATTLDVVSTSGWPNAPFRIRIGDELLKVTDTSGVTWTIERGIESTGSDNHTDGATITQVLTTGGLRKACQEIGQVTAVNDSTWACGYGVSVEGFCATATGAHLTAEYPCAQHENGGEPYCKRIRAMGYLETMTTAAASFRINGGSHNYYLSVLEPDATWFVRSYALAIKDDGNVNSFDFSFVVQNNGDGDTVEGVGTIRSVDGEFYSFNSAIAPVVNLAEEHAATIAIQTSGNQVSWNCNPGGSSPVRFVVDVHITELLMPVTGGGYYYGY